MTPNIYNLKGGGTLTVCHTDRFKSGLLSISFALPIEHTQVWKTSLLLSVLRRGTQKYPTLADINQRLDYLYGTDLSLRNFYRGDAQIIGFCADILNEELLPDREDLFMGTLDVIHQLLFEPRLDENGLLCEKYVESEKQQQCDQIRAQKNNPRGYASECCRELLYKNDPCGKPVLGSIEELRAITPRELTAHWKSLLASLTPTCFFIGAAVPERVKDTIEHMLCDALSHYRAPNKPQFTITKVGARGRAICREGSLPVGQSQLVLGLHTGVALTDAAYCACALYNELLGASPISKLFMNVRERLSLCYFCSSHYNAFKGTITVHCGLDRDKRKRAEREIRSQIRALAQGNFTEDELLAAKQSITNAYRQLSDNPAALESFYCGRRLAGISTTPQEMCQAFEAVTKAEVIAVAKAVTINAVYFLNGTLDQEAPNDEND